MQNKDIRDARKKQEAGGETTKPVMKKAYTVMDGDTLSKIAEKFYGDGAKYQKIHEANKDVIGPDADKIKPGMVLTIPPQ